MDRRQFIRRTSALGALGLAGCTGEGNNQGNGDNTGNGDDSPTETSTPEPVEVTGQSIETVESGCRDGDDKSTSTVETDEASQTVTITGTLATSQPCYEATLSTVEYHTDDAMLNVAVTPESTEEMCVDCLGMVEYEATIEFSGGVPETVDVSHEDAANGGHGDGEDDGEHSDDHAGGDSDTPSLVDSELSVTDVSGSASETTADASFDTEMNTVTVTGTIQGNNGCKTATLGNVTYNESDDHLTVDVETTDREDTGMCTQQLVYIDYEATITFEKGVPKEISVQHDGNGVMSGAHGSASAAPPDDQS